MLYVAPEHWRKGYGLALMREAMSTLEAQGVTEVILWVLHNNEQATAFYQAVGFMADGARQVKHRQDGTQMIVVRFRWKKEIRL
jgi:ribosomal protein S18 acetylase RimI-like enzyme